MIPSQLQLAVVLLKVYQRGLVIDSQLDGRVAAVPESVSKGIGD